MPSKRKTDSLDDGDSPMHGGKQTPLQISQRKRVKAKLQNPNLSSDTNRPRKKARMIAYYTEMRELNASFALFAKNEEEKINRQLSLATTTNGVEEYDYDEACLKYMRISREIHDRYFPATGDVLSMGTNEFGQIGLGEDVSSRMRPALITSLHNANVIQAAAGGLHSLTVDDKGVVNSLGCNDDGALGVVGVDTLYAPDRVKGFVPSAHEKAQYVMPATYTWKDIAGSATNKAKYSTPDNLETKYQENIVGVEAGDSHSLALSETGRVYFFGSYKDKEGKAWRDCPPPDDPRIHPNEEKRLVPPRGTQDWPIHVWQLKGEATQISCSYSMNAAIVIQKKEEGDTTSKPVLMTWGLGESGELARPVFGPLKKTEEEIEALPEGTSSYENFHIDKMLSDYLTPQPALFADGLTSHIVEKVICGGYHMLVIARDGDDADGASRIYSTGLNNYGQLGLGDAGHDQNRHKLTKIPSLANEEISMAAAGEHHSLCLDTSGTKLYAFGRSCGGQCGHVSPIPEAGSFESTPVSVYLNHSNTDSGDKAKKTNPVITKISAGGSHNFALTGQGSLYTWGYAFSGACGIGKPDPGNSDCVPLPQKVKPLVGVNKLREKNNKRKMKCTGIHSVVGGGQHSVMLATLQEI